MESVVHGSFFCVVKRKRIELDLISINRVSMLENYGRRKMIIYDAINLGRR